MKSVVISQSNYIPWKGYFDLIGMADVFVIYDDAQYTKRDWRNRNKIKTPNGLQWLTIPVEVKGRYLQKINETRIADKNWGQKHWKTIVNTYGKAPYFNLVSDLLSDLYLNKHYTLLSEINHAFIKKIAGFLGIKTRILRSEQFDLAEGRTERLLGICRQPLCQLEEFPAFQQKGAAKHVARIEARYPPHSGKKNRPFRRECRPQCHGGFYLSADVSAGSGDGVYGFWSVFKQCELVVP